MLEANQWQRPMVPVAEQIARTIQQQPGLILNAERIWKMLHFAVETRTELIARVMTKRIIADLEKAEIERPFADQLLKLSELTQWNQSARQVVSHWWRDYIRQQPLPRLQQLEKLLENKKALDEPRTTLNTMISMRKVFGKRTLEEFAEAIGTAYTVLQALSDSFDPESRHIVAIDQNTLRAELESREEEITPDARRVLAKNLKELGALIADMAEHRSRASLIRREEEVERQLMTGEQQPQSAIDMMKWLSGYLEGIQEEDEGET
jgi:hypothetical protein